ncbi:UDP-N-acetylmuramoyl-L-alanyl-D-glutamate--2,6-diaminopimelate ligase [Microbacterium sp.]|uniref:Mur ligase family protein n=1 Tax=Microbacterium sp. TaxID=51671 RepID=UPI00281110CC|nr:UDP-N-acetylmuramoyl-L-alanyl-D-glutamate--2,6-diaminopimelate ligase [Microbacterium sp.]
MTKPASNIPPVLRPENPPRRRLTELAERFGRDTRGSLDGIEVRGVTLATSDLHPGEVFVAINGRNRHGAEFAQAAADAGAVAIVTDAQGADIAEPAGLPIVIVDDPRGMLGELSKWAFGTDHDLPILLGTTGTDGKTSITHILDGILSQMGVVSGLSSSALRTIAGESVMARLTTPEAYEMHALLAVMRERHVEAAAIEVSVQAIMRHRVDAIVFDVSAFTNLSHDHMDDFSDMEEYLEAKLPLFRPDRARRSVVSLDTPAGAEVVQRAEVPVVTIATPAIAVDQDLAATAEWTVTVLEETLDGTGFTLTNNTDGRTFTSFVPVIGPHMAANAGMAILMLLEAGYSWERITGAIAKDGAIRAHLPGRAERIHAAGESGPAVYVDFGHTPVGIEKTLEAMRKVTTGKLVVMMGADGSRDTTKRFAMGKAAGDYGDVVIITDHNPRWEDPAVVRRMLLEGALSVKSADEAYEVVPPEKAIVDAVKLVGPGDAIIWFGPGHQDHREVQGVRLFYSGRELARRALDDAGWPVGERRWNDPYARAE